MSYKLEAINISKDYVNKVEEVNAVINASIIIEPGEKIAIVGPSGCGKSTFLNMLGLLIKPTSGKITLNSIDIINLSEKEKAQLRNEKFGYIVQDFALIEYYTVYENICIPLVYSKIRCNKCECKKKVENALEKVDLLEKMNTKVSNLSGGERQRVAIARAIINNPSIIFADEPTGSLDLQNSNRVFNILCELTNTSKSLVLVTHNIELAYKCDYVIKMNNGIISNEL